MASIPTPAAARETIPSPASRSALACARAASGSAATTASAANTPAAAASRRASIRAEHRGRNLLGQFGLLQRDEQRGRELLQLGGSVERRGVVEQRDERRDDLLVQDL